MDKVAGWMKWMQIDDVIDDNLDENRWRCTQMNVELIKVDAN